MERQRFLTWTGGGRGDPEDAARAAALPPLPPPEYLPRAAVITYWWGRTKFEVAAVGCAVRTTPWGDATVTWLHLNQTQTSDLNLAGGGAPGQTMATLVPAAYVTGVLPGPAFQLTNRHTSGDIGVYPPCHPPPAGALPLAAIEKALAGLADAPPDAGWEPFSLRLPLFFFTTKSGGVGSIPGPADRPVPRAIPLFTTRDAAARFLRLTQVRAKVGSFDRLADLRSVLRSVRDAGTHILFDPVPGADGVRAVYDYPAAVVLEQALPPVPFAWSYPVYLLRRGNEFASTFLVEERRREVLPVFTDADLAARAVACNAPDTTPVKVPDIEAFRRLIAALPPRVWGCVFDPPEAGRGGRASTAISRDNLLAGLDDYEL